MYINANFNSTLQLPFKKNFVTCEFFQATCLTHDITISRFQRARLTDDFVFAIEELSNLGKISL